MKSILFTSALPYFAMLLFISGNTLSQTFFNFWLWINIFILINNTSNAANEFIFHNIYVTFVFKMALFITYLVVYNKRLKSFHEQILDQPAVNWWVFSLIPVLFTILVQFIVAEYNLLPMYSRNYPLLFVVFILMAFVYLTIIYTFKQTNKTADTRILSHTLKEQVLIQKKQYANYLNKLEADNIFRHNQRFQDSIILKLLDDNDIEEAKKMIRKNQEMLDNRAVVVFCKNPIINAVLTEYKAQAEHKGIKYDVKVSIPETLRCDEVEFCVALSNLLENGIDAANKYLSTTIKYANNYILLNVKNDYSHTLKKKDASHYHTTKENGFGLGLRSVEYMAKNYNGYFEINDANNEFDVFVAINDANISLNS